MAKRSSGSQNKLWAVLSYIFVLWIVPLWIIERNDYAVYHARQAFGLFIAGLVASVLQWVPAVGWALYYISSIGLFILWIVGIVYAATGRKDPVPLLGEMFQEWFSSL
jgi:uncharacterized membrane protein